MRPNRMSLAAASPAEIRAKLLNVAEKLTARRDDADQILLQCADYFRNRYLLQSYAQEVGLILVNSYTNDEMQIYYELQWNGDTVGFISKGWAEPYYRLGQILCVAEDKLPIITRHSKDISILLATNGISFTSDRDEKKAMRYMNLTTNIPEAGFNKDTLAQAVTTMTACVYKIRGMIPCD